MDIEIAINKSREDLLNLLNEAMIELHDDMAVRIFKDLEDAKGGKPTPYDTKPLWVSRAALPREAGRSSKSGKTRYFAGGYSQLKSEIGRPPLELSGSLASGFRTGLRKISDLEYHVVLEEKDKVKVEGNFERFFKHSEDEIENLKKNLGAA